MEFGSTGTLTFQDACPDDSVGNQVGRMLAASPLGSTTFTCMAQPGPQVGSLVRISSYLCRLQDTSIFGQAARPQNKISLDLCGVKLC